MDTRLPTGGATRPHDELDAFPLRQSFTGQGDTAAFATQDLLDGLSRPGRFRLIACRGAGEILAVSEAALGEARERLAGCYGDSITFGKSRVHAWTDVAGGPPRVPFMFVRLDAPRDFNAALAEALRQRGAQVQELVPQRDRVVIRAVAAMSALMGFERAVLARWGESVQVLCWLLHYAPLPEAFAAGTGADADPQALMAAHS